MVDLDENSSDGLRPFSSADIVKVYAATFLPLCEMLAAAGVASNAQIAQAISNRIPPTETGVWAQLARAIVDVLAPPPAQAAPKPAEPPPFTVMPGGRS